MQVVSVISPDACMECVQSRCMLGVVSVQMHVGSVVCLEACREGVSPYASSECDQSRYMYGVWSVLMHVGSVVSPDACSVCCQSRCM